MTDPTRADHLTAQRIAFAPLMFQAARCARDMGVLDVLHAAGEVGLTCEEVAERAAVSPYAARVLLDACTAMELVLVDGERHRLSGAGVVTLTDPRTRVHTDFVHDVCYRGAFDLEASLREGRAAGLPALGPWPNIYEGVPELPANIRRSWYAFDHFYSDSVFPRAVRFLRDRGISRILDVGGNTGRFAVQAAEHMHVTMLDHEGQLRVARTAAQEAGVSDRIETVPMDLLDHSRAFPRPFDGVWMSQFLDCFGEDDITALLARGRAALGENGRVFVVETFTDRQPAESAAFSLHATSLYFAALANGRSRMYRSTDLVRCAEQAGLKVELDRTIGPWHTLLVLAP